MVAHEQYVKFRFLGPQMKFCENPDVAALWWTAGLSHCGQPTPEESETFTF